MALTFEWDPRKGAANRKKHGVGFGEAWQSLLTRLAVLLTTRITLRESVG